ncbi:MAG: hypothetical protein LBM93_00610 [Oscillospiraceae bacterium]|nr:hypothetical protein [Oscillospiraceae bacterium]
MNLCGEYITNDFEKYKFEWNGKGEAIQLAGSMKYTLNDEVLLFECFIRIF